MMISSRVPIFSFLSLTTPLPISLLARYPFATRDTSTLTIATPWESTRLGSTVRKPATAIAITPANTRDLAALRGCNFMTVSSRLGAVDESARGRKQTQGRPALTPVNFGGFWPPPGGPVTPRAPTAARPRPPWQPRQSTIRGRASSKPRRDDRPDRRHA